jgi:argininosuccinate lyase
MSISSSTPSGIWGGRFTEATDAFVAEFTASVSFDQRLALYDIQGSQAHAAMLAEVGVLTSAERDQLIAGLDDIAQQIREGKFEWSLALEDVHMNIEARLTQKLGEVGKKLHTGRSRNDQVATDIRLWLRAEIDQLRQLLQKLLAGLAGLAERHTDTIMPGFTHLQVAQPVTFGHHVLAWAAMLERDWARLGECRHRVNQLPLGAAALAGTTFPIDREFVAKKLGFDGVCSNSLDAVSDRDFAMEFCGHASIVMVHLSRIAEELVLWAGQQFEFIRLPDRYCTGSSIMPQKKNPDVPELVRGKAGRVVGHSMAMYMLMKSQPLAYNKDNQEDKEPLFDTVDTLRNCLMAFADMLPNLQVQADNMRRAALAGYSTATDLADYLVRKGLAFRDAHEVVGQVVQFAIKNSLSLEQVALKDLQQFCPQIQADVQMVLTLEGSVAARDHLGGTAPAQVRKQVRELQQRLAAGQQT